MFRPLLMVGLLLASVAGAGCTGGGQKQESGEPPEASFSFTPAAPGVDETIQFQDESSGGIEEWSWDFGDGGSADGQGASHAYETAGVYEVRLRVEDGAGRSDEAARFVQVGGSGGGDGLRVDFRYKVSQTTVDFEPVVQPPGASVEQYFWDFGDGETSKESAPVHTYGSIGEYVVELRVATSSGLASTQKRVAVGVAPSEPSGLAGRSFAVIAIVDSGINPYHEEFAAPEFLEHPSTYIDGYPEEGEELPLTLDARTYGDAVKADEEQWKEIKGSKLYWIPGTRIVGAVSMEKRGERRILDDGGDGGHGTATASDAAGATVGACPTCLIVVVEGLGDGPLRWALSQPWIDIVSNSWTSTLCPVVCVADANLAPPVVAPQPGTREAVQAGKSVLFAAGNGMLNAFESPQLTYWSAYNGPDWVITVGAADAGSGATIAGTGRPVDVVSYGLNWRAASHNSKESIREFSGTSAATPIVAGALGHVLRETRAALGDTQEGPHSKGVLATGEKGNGLVADGKLTRAELERAVFATAKAASGTPIGFPPMLPHSPFAFAYAGYGIVDAKTAKDALAVVLGDRSMPSRANEDTWAGIDSQIRRSIWGSYDPGGEFVAVSDSNDLRQAWWDAILGPS